MAKRWLTRRAISLHLALLVFVPAFFFLGWWQLHRALSGNGLSWAYTFEWPIFAAYATYLWWRIIHDQEDPVRTRRLGRRGSARADRRSASDARADVALRSYNAYLASLADGPDRAGKEARD